MPSQHFDTRKNHPPSKNNDPTQNNRPVHSGGARNSQSIKVHPNSKFSDIKNARLVCKGKNINNAEQIQTEMKEALNFKNT